MTRKIVDNIGPEIDFHYPFQEGERGESGGYEIKADRYYANYEPDYVGPLTHARLNLGYK